MNIYVVPSWYPNQRQPMSGIFTKEQAIFISQHPYIDKVIVQDYGYSVSHISFNSIKNIAETIFWKFKSKKEIRENQDFIEIFDPMIGLPGRVPFGGIKRLVNHSKKIFEEALNLYNEIDLIHAHVCYPGGYIAFELSKYFKIPYVITEHMGPFPFPEILSKDGKLKKEAKLAFENASKVIAVSNNLKEEILKHNIPKVDVIGNLVDEDFFRIKEYPKNDIFTFFSFGRLHPIKGFNVLIDAIKILKNENINAHFRVGGDGPSKEKYLNQAKKLNISENITWLGDISRKEALEEYQKCDAYVLPSLHESFGMTYIEALACGKPIIVAKSGAPEELISNNNGEISNSNDPKDLARCIKKIIENGSFKPKLIREDCLESFSKSIVVDKIVNIYKNI